MPYFRSVLRVHSRDPRSKTETGFRFPADLCCMIAMYFPRIAFALLCVAGPALARAALTADEQKIVSYKMRR